MSLHCFFIAARAPQPAQSELNRFLAGNFIGNETAGHPLLAVIPANAGTRFFGQHFQRWIPAFAGTTAETGPVSSFERASSHRAFAARSERPHVDP